MQKLQTILQKMQNYVFHNEIDIIISTNLRKVILLVPLHSFCFNNLTHNDSKQLCTDLNTTIDLNTTKTPKMYM